MNIELITNAPCLRRLSHVCVTGVARALGVRGTVLWRGGGGAAHARTARGTVAQRTHLSPLRRRGTTFSTAVGSSSTHTGWQETDYGPAPRTDEVRDTRSAKH